MNKPFYILLFVFLSIFCKAQVNLVPNPSFELYDICPNGIGEIYRCKYWNTSTDATPDYFNPCANTVNAGVPSNIFGYEYAHTGNSYAGFVNYAGGVTSMGFSYREYIQCKLLSNLESNTLYKVSFYISQGDSGTYASNNIGVYFSNANFYFSNGGFNLSFLPSCNETEIITKNVGWQIIEFYYLATGNENYITIGNFYNDSLTSSKLIIGGGVDPYYYIDDIAVEKIDWVLPNVFTPNNDGVNDEWIVNNLPANTQIQIFNRWGGLVINAVAQGTYRWDGKTKTGLECSDGTYYYVISGKDKESIKEKGFVQLIR
ncbi:MAG: gliding motility-associated C-terminal domain-containing protein [Bacteroidota bacterium]